MLFSIQALVAVLAGLTSVRAQSLKPCFKTSNKAAPGYFDLDSQECCSPDFAVRENDEVRCNKTAVTPFPTEDFPECSIFFGIERSCQKGIRMSPETFPQQGRCGAVKERVVTGSAPNDNVGCYSGRLFVNGGKCCSKEYVIDDGIRIRCGDADMEITGPFPADNLPPAANVPLCNGTIGSHWCPEGVITTSNAIESQDVCKGTGCCAGQYVRDGNGVCRHFQLELSTLRKYWSIKEYIGKKINDGCPRPEKGNNCCPEIIQFRNWTEQCSTRTSLGKIPDPETLLSHRTDDNCHDYIHAINVPLFQDLLNATSLANGTEVWKESVEKWERERQQELQRQREPWQGDDGKPIWG